MSCLRACKILACCNVRRSWAPGLIAIRSARLLTMLVIPFSLCQARLAVFVFIAGAFFAAPPPPPPPPGGPLVLVIFGFYGDEFRGCHPHALLSKACIQGRDAFAALSCPLTAVRS